MLPGRPPGGPRIPTVLFPPLLATWVDHLPLVAYFLAAEVLIVFSTSVSVALDLYSRSRLLEFADARGLRERVERCLVHVGAYELTVRLTRFLGSVLMVVGLAFLLLGGVFADPDAHPAEVPWDALAGVVGITFLVNFLLNDLVVRVATRRHPSRLLLRALPALEVLRYVTAPIRLPLVLLGRLLFRVELEQPEPSAREEVMESVEEGEREGTFTADEADMIEGIMDLDTVTAVDICTPRGEIAMLQEATRLDEAARYMIEEGHRRLPVYGRDRDDVVGVVYAFDLLAQVARGKLSQRVREIMRSPYFVPEGKPLNDLLSELRGRRISMAVVLNEFGAISGVVTMADVLERIVGEIEDEHDRDEPPPPVRDGAMEVDGRTPIEDVNEALSVSLPVEEDFETVGGLVFHRMGKVPAAGDEVTVDGVCLRVTDADERTVRRVRVQIPPPAE